MTARGAASLGLAVLAAVACRGPRAERPAASCTHVQATREVRGSPLCEDVWTCGRPPGGRFDRVGLHRLAPCTSVGGPIVLYLPGMHMNGELALQNPRQDFRLYLAAAGLRTWGIDYRTHAVPAEAQPADLAVLGSWTAEVFLADVRWAAGFVRGTDKGPLFVAGFSHGGALTYRLAAQPDRGLAGIIVLDGATATARSSGGGDVAIDVGGRRLPYAERQRLLDTVIADPSRPSPLPGYPSAGEALGDILYSAESFGGHGGLANTRDQVSDLRVLATLLRSYDRWWPRAALDASPPEGVPQPLPVVAFSSTQLGPAWVERVKSSAHTLGGSAALVHELPGYGHLDVLVGREAARDVFEPTLSWLRSQTPP